MQAKYNKYWGDFDKVNKYFFLAIVFDPRHKLEKVIDFFEVLFGHSDDVLNDQVKEVRELLKTLHGIYGVNVHKVDQQAQSETMSGGSSSSSCVSSDSDNLDDFERILLEKSKLRKARKNDIIHNDLDRYLSDPIEDDDNESFNVLMWWKVNGASKYPVMGLIARDILAIPVSTIASESCFSTSGRIIDSFRSSLSPKMVQALICTQNWLRGDQVALDDEPTPEEMELLETIENEMTKEAAMLPPKTKK
jgi:hypothetical protein